jgi:putative phosphoesterase
MVGLVSDTHGWFDEQLVTLLDGAAMILHAGDVGRADVLSALEAIAPVVAVRGNIDGGELRGLSLERVVEVNGRRIGALHIAGQPQRPKAAARAMIQRERLDVLVVGHSHIPVVGRVDGALWINPGAAGREGHHDLRFAARLWISPEGELALERLHLGPRPMNA